MLKTHVLKPVKGRVIIVGDIHGCVDEFNALLDKLDVNPKTDKIVLVGDLVNKGYDSIGTVKRAMGLNCFCVMGNHDAALLTCIDRLREGDIRPEEHPDDQLVQLAASFPDTCTRFLRSLPYVLEIPQFDHVVVHAGFNPTKPMHEQNVWDVLHMRRLSHDGRALDSGTAGTPWAKKWKGPPTVVFGHDARSGLQQEKFAIGLDTGCCYGGELTAYVLPQRELVSVKGSTRPVAKKPRLPVVHPGGVGDTPQITLTSCFCRRSAPHLWQPTRTPW